MRARIWRAVYGVFESDAIVAIATIAVGAGSMLFGRAVGARFDGWFDRLLVRSGWPYHVRGWTNLHMARALTRIQRRRGVAVHTVTQAVGVHGRHRGESGRLRIGVIGAFRGLLSFPAELFRRAPSDVEVVAFDIPYRGRGASFLEPYVSAYAPVLADEPMMSASAIERAARRILEHDCDVLLNVNEKLPAYDLIDALDHSRITHYCNGSEPLYHDKVQLQFYPQPEADYFVRNQRLFCTTTRTDFCRSWFVPIAPYYDLRTIDAGAAPGWQPREPLVTFHGSLYKLASPGYLEVLFRLLSEDRALSFRFMGKDNGSALAYILDCARRWNLGDRVSYEGEFQSDRDADGEVSDPGWIRMQTLLRRARLQANPWPLGGGSSRVEAYACGVPCIALRTSFEERHWNAPQPVVCDVPAIHALSGTALDAEDYLDRCRRCLYDEAWFDRVAAEQQSVLRTLTDPARWWLDVIDAYRTWIQSPSAGPQLAAASARV
jgi:hypothetical protein